MNILKTFCLLIISAPIFAQSGIVFFQGSWGEALETAKKEHKIIFMDAYAEWCGPCKRMAKEVFTLKEVGDFYNKYFINVKMDMEKGEGPKLASKYRVSAYPTLFFINDKGEMVNSKVGGLNADQLIGLGKATLAQSDNSKNYAEEYEKGNRDPEMLKAYAYSLLISGQPTLKIANEYIKTQKNIESSEFLEFLFDFTTEADCSIFDKLVNLKDKIISIKTEEVYKKKIQNACDATVDKAVEFQNMDLLAEAKKQMKLAVPSFATEYSLLADIRFAFNVNNEYMAISSTKKYVQKFCKKDAEKLNYHAMLFFQYIQDKKGLALAENWAKQAYELKKNKKYAKSYAELLKKNGKKDLAIKIESEMKGLKNE
jgi:thiol-disulfide isomerase/thioredoxin